MLKLYFAALIKGFFFFLLFWVFGGFQWNAWVDYSIQPSESWFPIQGVCIHMWVVIETKLTENLRDTSRKGGGQEARLLNGNNPTTAETGKRRLITQSVKIYIYLSAMPLNFILFCLVYFFWQNIKFLIAGSVLQTVLLLRVCLPPHLWGWWCGIHLSLPCRLYRFRHNFSSRHEYGT